MTAVVAPVRLPLEHLGEAAAVMGRAIVDDPLLVYLMPDARERAAGAFPMMRMFLRIGLTHGEVWVTPPPIAGVACWLLPAHLSVTESDRDAAGWSEVVAVWGSEVAARYRAFLGDMGRHRFARAGAALAAHLARRRAGAAGAGHRRCPRARDDPRADAQGMACWLFTFTPRNVPIYEHLGFHVTLDTILPSSGLRLWAMAHPPRRQP
jgi:hypothetical protein